MQHENRMITTSAVSLAVGNLGRGMRWAIFENLSTTVSTKVIPPEQGNPMIKSKEMCNHDRRSR